jgi:fructan beta-fructosidase
MRFIFLYIATLFVCCTQNPKPKPVEADPVPQQTYLEQHRPQFHFSPDLAWMNDPNGMVYYEGEYHLFYQYYPDSTVWGPMHWAHAVSTDLVHWEHLPIALYPDSLGYIFSGSAVVDWQNTSGFGVNGKPPLVAMYTYHNMPWEKAGRQDFQYQAIAYSNDKGRSWTKYRGNPVIPNPGKVRDFRDTKVCWHEGSKKWIMALATKEHLKIYGSSNLKEWTFLSDFGEKLGAHGGIWECPDLFPIQIEGTDQERWVLIQNLNPGAYQGGSGAQYFIGNFDGTHFTCDSSILKQLPLWIDYGRDNYAGVTWSDIPATDGRRIHLGWMSNWDYAQVVPTGVWRSAMTLPRELILRNTSAGLRIVSVPVKELSILRSKTTDLHAQALTDSLDLTSTGINAAMCEVELELEFAEGAKNSICWLELKNTLGERYRVGYDADKNQYFSDRTQSGKKEFSPKFATKVHTAPRIRTGGPIKIRCFFDRSSCELFADQGEVTLTDIYFPNEDYSTIKLYTTGGGVQLVGGKVHALKSIWK